MSSILRDPTCEVSKVVKTLCRLRSLNSVEIYFREPIGPLRHHRCFEQFKALSRQTTNPGTGSKPADQGFYEFVFGYFGSKLTTKRIEPYRDGTGMVLLNFLPENSKDQHLILGLRILPKHFSNRTAFLELFETPKNRETTFKIYDPGNLYLGPLQHVYWTDTFSKPDTVTEFILKKSPSEQREMERDMQADNKFDFCCCVLPLQDEESEPNLEFDELF
jgi:hypothetical protein